MVRAYADLARSTWPLAGLVLALVVLFIFKSDVRKLIPHIKEVSIAGGTVTLQDRLAEDVVPIQVSTQAAGFYVPPEGKSGNGGIVSTRARVQAVGKIYSRVEQDPRGALAATATELDNSIRELL